jgi:hypothetical protein
LVAPNVVSFAFNVVLRPPLFAVNVVSILACLQFKAFMFAVRYTYLPTVSILGIMQAEAGVRVQSVVKQASNNGSNAIL